MMNRYHVLIIIILVAMVVNGCSRGSVNFIEWTGPVNSVNYLKGRRIYTDKALSKRIEIENVNTRYDRDQLLRAQVTLRNQRKRMQTIEYRFEWFDAEGIRIDTPASRWIMKQIYGGDSVAIAATAPNTRAKDFVFKIKRK